jgi:urease accessory protein
VHPPGGIVAGDRLELGVHAAPGAQVLLTTPAATKFYRGAPGGPVASQLQQLSLDDATLEWLPQENIFFPDAQARVTTRVHLTPASRFIGWETGCFGLPANQRGLAGGRVVQSFELWLQGRPLLIERLRVDGAEAGLAGRWGLAGDSACGTLLAFPATAQLLTLARDCIAQQDAQHGAVTLVENLLVCRALAPDASQVRALFTALWCALRPQLLQRAARPPRIWAT